jgi:hypothetical protein
MSRLGAWRWRERRLQRKYGGPVDLGGGRQVAAEDVLEGHFRRMARADRTAQFAQAAQTAQAGREVSVQLAPGLTGAIRVMAPQLAPLTEVAEELASAFPSVRPAPEFRNELHRALEIAHREHMAARAELAQRKAAQGGRRISMRTWLWALAPTLVVAVVAAVVAWWVWRRRKK